MQTMHLFAGAGGGLLADIILGHTPIVAVEWEPYACQVLRERAEDGWFPGLQVWEGDVRLFDPSEYTGQVDCINAGFPCQDISTAGNQAGIGEGTRSNLYKEVLRIASIVRPKYIFLENVAAITSKSKDYLEVICKDLAAVGYDAVWTTLSAAEVGANHKRDRWWMLAYATSNRLHNKTNFSKMESKGSNKLLFKQSRDTENVAYSKSKQRNGSNNYTGISMGQNKISESGNGSRERTVAYSNSAQCERRRLSSGTHTKHADFSKPSWWEIEPKVGRVADGIPARVQRLKALGNGQVPLQAAVAWKILEEIINDAL